MWEQPVILWFAHSSYWFCVLLSWYILLIYKRELLIIKGPLLLVTVVRIIKTAGCWDSRWLKWYMIWEF